MAHPACFDLGPFRVEPAANRLMHADGVRDVEPKIMDLLVFLASRPGEVLDRETIADAVWPGVTVNEDALGRAIWKLRQALGDDARAPRFVHTVPKRGYRLIQSPVYVENPGSGQTPKTRRRAYWIAALAGAALLVAAIGLAGRIAFHQSEAPAVASADETGLLIARADAFYHQFTRVDNEAALRLYEAALDRAPGDAAALAGLANALTQRELRYGGLAPGEPARTSLSQALASGHFESAEAKAALTRAQALAEAAVQADPGHARAHRALGLVLSTRREPDLARAAYERALVIDPDAWGALINLADIHRIEGDDVRYLAYLEQAHAAMERAWTRSPVEIRPWHSAVGLLIARERETLGDLAEAETWYWRILALDPLNVEAVTRLSGLLRRSGDAGSAEALCADLLRRTGQGCT